MLKAPFITSLGVSLTMSPRHRAVWKTQIKREDNQRLNSAKWSTLNSSRMFIFFAVASAPKQCCLFTSYTKPDRAVYVKFHYSVKDVKQAFKKKTIRGVQNEKKLRNTNSFLLWVSGYKNLISFFAGGWVGPKN